MRRREGIVAGGLAAVALLAACTPSDRDVDRPVKPSTSSSPITSQSHSPAGRDEPTTAPSTTGSARQRFKPRTMTVVMSGDVLLHEGLWATAEIDAGRTGRGPMDFRPLLADLRPIVSGADLAVCHMETPLAPPGGPYLGYPLFAAPPAIVGALRWEGYDACTTASNHSIDQGFDGLTRTLRDFAAAGIDTAGTAATRQDSRAPLVMDVEGVFVGLISASYGTNGIPLPADQPWSVPLIDSDKIIRQASLAKQMGADIVMVALHWGVEYIHPPSQDQLDVAAALTKSADIDLIYGHHAHVVQPYDKVNGTWVVYGLGNAVAQQETGVEGVYDGNTARVTFSEKRDGSFRVTKLQYIPTMITRFDGVHPMRWLNVPQDVDDPDFAASRPQLLATEKRVRTSVNLLGALSHGVTEGR